CAGVYAQGKDANDFFENTALARKVNNMLPFIEKSSTINLNDYYKSIIYILVSPNHERSFSISLRNQLPVNKVLYKCSKLSDNRFIVFVDKSDENFGETEEYKKNFKINTKELISCDDLFKKLKENKLPEIPENVFAYVIFEDSLVYLEDLATFDALEYLQIEYGLNEPYWK